MYNHTTSLRIRSILTMAVLCLIGGVGLVNSLGAQGEKIGFQIVIHPANPVNTMTKEEVSRLFLKYVTAWPQGGKVHPVDLSPASATRETFSRAIHGRPAELIRSHWIQRVFSGRSTQPPELKDDAAVIEYILKHPGAIGYVSNETDVSSVRVLDAGGE